jgi:hypothetical protein
MFFAWATRGMDLEAEGRPEHSSSSSSPSAEVLQFLKYLNHL